MKKAIIILISFVAIIILSAIIFINPILNSAKPKILDKLTEVLKTKVSVGEIDVSIFPKPRFILKDLVVGEEGKYQAVLLKEFSIFVSTKEIISGVISISSISIVGADIPVVKKKDGTMLVGSYPVTTKTDSIKVEETPSAKVDLKGNIESKEPLKIDISELNIRDFKVSYKEEDGLDFNLNKFDLSAVDDNKNNYNVKSSINLEDNDLININGVISKDIIFKGIKSDGKLDLVIDIDVANNINNLLIKLKNKMSYEGDLNKILCKVTKQEAPVLNLTCSGTDTGNIRGIKLSIDDIKLL